MLDHIKPKGTKEKKRKQHCSRGIVTGLTEGVIAIKALVTSVTMFVGATMGVVTPVTIPLGASTALETTKTGRAC